MFTRKIALGTKILYYFEEFRHICVLDQICFYVLDKPLTERSDPFALCITQTDAITDTWGQLEINKNIGLAKTDSKRKRKRIHKRLQTVHGDALYTDEVGPVLLWKHFRSDKYHMLA